MHEKLTPFTGTRIMNPQNGAKMKGMTYLGEAIPGRLNVKVNACMKGNRMEWIVRCRSTSKADVLAAIAESVPTSGITNLEIIGVL
jgi:hypothetical protein